MQSKTQLQAPATISTITVGKVLHQAIDHHKAGRLQEAERLYRAILQEQPQHPDANHNLGVLAAGVNKPTDALSFLKTALQANPGQQQYWLSYIDVLIRAGQSQVAQQVITAARQKGLNGEPLRQLEQRLEALQKNTSPAPSPYETAISHREAGHYREAATWLQTWLAEHPQDAEAHALLSHILLLDKKEEAANAAIECALAIAPSLPVVQRNQARLLLKQQKTKAALQVAQAAYQNDPKNPESLLVLAATLQANKQNDQASLLVERALRARPDYAEAYATRALLKMHGNDNAGALADAEYALAIKPHLVQLWGIVSTLHYRFKNLHSAIKAQQKALEYEPDNVDHMIILGEFLRQDGQIEAAITMLQRTVTRAPENAGAWTNLGTALQDAGRIDEAKDAYANALKINPQLAEIANNLGAIAKKAENWEEALSYFDQALAIKPNHVAILSNRAAALTVLERYEEAEQTARQAVDIDTTNMEAQITLSNALIGQKRYEDALDVLDDIPPPPTADTKNTCHLANVYAILFLAQERWTDAEDWTRKALAIRPDYAEAYNNLGVALQGQSKPAEAVASYRQALLIKPDYAEAYNNLGNALQGQGNLDEALASYRQALLIKPDYAEAYNNLGVVLEGQGKLEEAVASYRQALLIKPDYAKSYSNLGNALEGQGKLEEAVASYRQALLIRPDFAEIYSNLLFHYGYQAMLAPDEYLTVACGWEKACLPMPDRETAARRTFQRPPLTGRRLKIGYVSGDYRQHAVSYFLQKVFACHDRTRLELFAYSTSGKRDAITEEYMSMVDHYVPLTRMNNGTAAARIKADGIDVLIDCSGHTGQNRLGIFALRAAPVQAHYLGFFASTGLSEMDYWIGDEILTPPETDGHFTERVWRLPRVWVGYEGKTDVPLPDWRPDPSGIVWLGSFNNLNKLTPVTLALWAKVLHALPEGRLLLKARELADDYNRQRILDTMTSHGISSGRIELHDRSVTPSWSSHMAYYNRLDIALDPVGGVGGGTTTCDALWMAVPLINMIGDRMASRMTASMLHAIGRPEWIARSEEDYVDKIVSLARNVDLRKSLRVDQRPQMAQSPLCDTQGLTKELESAYFGMYERWHDGAKTDVRS